MRIFLYHTPPPLEGELPSGSHDEDDENNKFHDKEYV